MALAVAATTQASSRIVGYFELGGEFEGSLESHASAKLAAADVNADGAGGASPGDVYVFGAGGVRQLSADDKFIRTWGIDVVKGGPGQADEIQSIRVDATGGTFRLAFGDDITADLAAAATAAQVQAALDGLPSIGAGGVSVTGGPGDAGGTVPYTVRFDGASFAGKDQPQVKATNGSVPLSGAGAAVSVYTNNTGGTGFEICEPSNGDECDDSSGFTGDIAVDQSSGDVYVADNDRIEKYSASGQFLRAWGRDVVAAGPDDSNVDEQKSVTVKATGGTFTLGFRERFGLPVESTPPLAYNASAATVEAALNNLAEIGGNYSSVTVTGGPGDLTGSSPYLITFHGLLGGDDLANGFSGVLLSNPNGLTISSGTKSAEIATVTDGGREEICLPRDACKSGVEGDVQGSLDFRSFRASLEVAPAGTPNAGNVIGGNAMRRRVQEYGPDGNFIRAFGWGVDATEPGAGFEVCTADSGHVCQTGSAGSGAGQFGEDLSGVAEDSSGAIYTVEGSSAGSPGGRVQKFTPAGSLNLTPSAFGTNETQALTVNAGAGQFRLTFGAEKGGTQGVGDITPRSKTVTNVAITKGEFAVGQTLRNVIGNNFEVEIVAVGPNTITLSEPATTFGNSTSPEVPLLSDRPYRTAALPYNASAGEVATALNSLPSINAGGSSVSVTEGPGDVGGSSPYSITFDGGLLARNDMTLIETSNGPTPLSGGSGAGVNTASVVTTTAGGPEGNSADSAPFDIGIGPSDLVSVAKFFPKSFTKCEDGSLSPSEIRLEELDSTGTVLQTSDVCNGLHGLENGRTSSLTVNPTTGHAYLLNQNSGFEAPRINIFGSPGPAPDLALGPISGIKTTGGTVSGTINPNGPGTSYPDTTGTPVATKTTYRVEFKVASDSDWTPYTVDIPLSSGTTPTPFSVGVEGLAPNTEYEMKVVAVKPFVAAVEGTASFTTLPAGPKIEGLFSSNVTVNSAELRALINPQGSPTSYHFEYGTTRDYGSSTPETDIGAAHSGQPASDQIEGLSDALYHFRVIATNTSGTATSEDQTFTYHPPVCPNQTVRQQTGAAYLPDCRAYELVSPEDAGGTTLFTGGPQSPNASNPPRLAFVGQLAAIPDSGRNPINTAGDLYIATRGPEGWHTRYVGPSSEEVGCAGGRPLGSSGAGRPSTIQNDVMADASLGRILDWNLGNPLECVWGAEGDLRFGDHNTAAQGSNAPYVWNAHGDFLDRWPTATADVPGSEANFSCPQDPSVRPYPADISLNIPVSYFCATYVDASKDLTHFVFSTQSGLYGEGGLSVAPGSAYDNDTTHNTLSLVSKLPGGGPIGQEPGAKAGPEELIQFPAVSADGSHILMGTATKPACKNPDYPLGGEDPANPLCPILTQPTHLYMRVDNAVSYDVSAGKPVQYVGATPDGTRVYFTSKEQLTGDDADTSTDLYMWSENGGSPTLTRISRGETGSAGNTDNCVATWTKDCDVETYKDSSITATRGNLGGLGTFHKSSTNPGHTDNAIAAASGDIYFYSPEQLVDGKGVPGKENLYVYRAGGLRHVATLNDDRYCLGSFRPNCSNGAVGRLQVTPDGRYAAFITTSRLTAYDNHGFAEMYRYDADAEALQCVSCRPDGSPPVSDVLGSQGGRFITDDGRVFFDTPEPLDPRDTNFGHDGIEGAATGYDVYEFTDGRPQLISTGTGTIHNLGFDSVEGLYGVSADGVDVYFGTFETLVGQDRNGQQLKFYDARTNGGFSFVPPPAPCAAADECHGPTAASPAPVVGGTSAALGAGGNANHANRPKKKHQRGKHRRGKKAQGANRAHNKAGGGR